MAAWLSNEIRDYLIAKGIGSVEATAIQVFVIRMAATNPQDASLVKGIEGQIANIIAVVAGTYGLGLNAGAITAWILVNRPDLASAATLYGNVVYTDIPAMIDTPALDPASSTTWSLKNLYLEAAAGILKMICYYLRHYCVNEAYADGHSGDMAYGTGPLQPSTSIPGVSEYLWN
jgi:hypothetical protein